MPSPASPMPSTGLPRSERFSVCQHVLRLGDIAADVVAAAMAGCRAFSVNAADVGQYSPAKSRQVLDDAGLAVSSYIDPALMRLGPAEPDLDAVDRAFEAAAVVGAPCFLFIAGPLGGREHPAADAQLVDALGRIRDRTRGTGVLPMLEPLHPVAQELSHVHAMRHSLDLVRQVDGVGLVIDTGASWWEHDLVDQVAANLDLIYAIQITDVSEAELNKRVYVRDRCAPPAGGAVPVGPLVRAFVAAGFDGWFEHEVLASNPRDVRVRMLADDRAWFATLWD